MVRNITQIPLGNLEYRIREKDIYIRMIAEHAAIYTTQVPHIAKVLKSHLPEVLKTKCFNERNLPFSREVKNTEIAHLFEHILLVYLCKISVEQQGGSHKFSGVTSWDWNHEEKGTFHITINASLCDNADVFHQAFEQSVELLNILYGDMPLHA